mmetsp:Transcript_20227/g.32775  ORF Transcript_20227/g.32775 Transcript_20227/m.32775 type:complete len:208 (+) Transcript_20227:1039-1662(+)
MRPACDERLLVSQADVLARLDGGHRGGQPGASHDASHGGVHVRMPCDLDHAVGAVEDLGHGSVHALDEVLKRLYVGAVGNGHHLGLELPDLRGQNIEVLARGQRDDLEFVGVLRRNVQRLRADGTCRPQQRNLLHVAVPEERRVLGSIGAPRPARTITGLGVASIGTGRLRLGGSGSRSRLGAAELGRYACEGRAAGQGSGHHVRHW